MTPKQAAERALSFVTEQLPLLLVYILLALVPLFFIPITADFFDINKQALLFVSATLITLAWAVQAILRQKVRITISPLTVPMLVFVGAFLLSSFISTPYSYEALLGRGLVLFSLVVFSLFATSLQKNFSSKLYIYVLTGSTAVLSVTSILETFGIGLSRILNTLLKIQLPTNGSFSFAGSALNSALLLVPVIAVHAVELFFKKGKNDRIFHGIALGVLVLGLTANIFVMLPGKPAQPIMTPVRVSWSVAVDSFKNLKTAFLGYGPESFQVAFTQNRPLTLNTTPYWNVLFTTSRTELLNIIPTLGLVGTVAWVILMLAFLRVAFPMRKESRPLSVVIGIIVLEQLLFPAPIVTNAILFITATLLTIMLKQQKDERMADIILHLFAVRIVAPGSADKIEQHAASRILAIVLSVAVLAGIGVSTFFLGRVYAAEMLFYRSLRAAQTNNGKATYELQGRAVTLAPLSDKFRRAFASTNFLIAENIASSTQATDQDRNTIPQLIQQSIREGKAATNLDGRKTLNWQTLATIYRTLINVADGADQWAIAAYVRAIQTDPTNPLLRLDLGGVYVSMQNYEQAIRLFQQAAELKPDWPNAHFNLANAYRLKGEKQLALDALRETLRLLPMDNTERPKVEAQIAELERQVRPTTQQPRPQATPKPTPTPTPQLPQGEIRLPQDLGLPEATPPTSAP